MQRAGRHSCKNVVDLDQDDDYAATRVADVGIYFSIDGQTRSEEVSNIRHKKRRVGPSDLKDPLAEWIPGRDDDFTEDAARETEEIVVDLGTVLGKRKQYASTTDPMSLFRPMKAFFLDELLRHEGLGDDLHDPRCAHCQRQWNAAVPSSPRIFKCYECGEFLQCQACCLGTHARTPLHTIREWNGTYWTDNTLAKIGLVYQLGHGGFPCPFPDDLERDLTVIEAPILHQIRMRYCKCEKSDDADNLEQLLRNAWYPATVTDPGTCATFRTLESFRMYSVVGNLNARDFVTAIERVRYKQLQRMGRQWAFIKRTRRAGRGHDPAGVDKTALGECAVTCWACPHDGRNLPENWRDVDPKYRFLFMLLLAVDANFRLKNRMRTNEIEDPSLGPGWGYWVEPEAYREHLKKYVHEKDVSTCIAFAALLQKDTRLTTGLRVSGVGGVVCARHECMRPNGLGDLQKGERYSNMDWIVMAALAGFTLMLLTISYDIACQWKVNLRERLTKLPHSMTRHLASVKLQCGLPVWHASSHNDDCKNKNSLSFKPGVGKSDGEGVERTWSVLNPSAFSTKDAGIGLRADVLEGKIDNHNYLKNVGQGDALQRKLVVAIVERDRQIAAFKEVNKTLSREVKKEWEDMIDAWLEDDTKTNPYILKLKDCPTEAEVRVEVRKDEAALNATGSAPLNGRSATAFLTAGIQIEDTQRRIIAELRGTVLVAADRENKIGEWRHTLLNKIGRFRRLQKIYMPGVALSIADAEAARDTDATPPKPENVTLFMPSELAAHDVNKALAACVPGLLDMEAKLRVAQCENCLVSLRSRLHGKRFLIGFRNENVTGQIQSTKAATLIGQVGERVEGYAKRYRKGHAALLSLKGQAACPHLRELKPDDVRLDGDDGESDAASRKKLAMIGMGRGARAPRNAPGTSKRTMSWIWTAPGALEKEEHRLHDSIRVEWARARARKIRWTEEVMLLREEMRRVLRYLDWQSNWWRERAALRDDWSAAIAAGARAYAMKQAAWHDELARYFQTKWAIPAVTAAQQILATDNEELDDFFGND
ncbi:hypothetical protein C8R47DRAFT_1286276 [Mycena vitilis]|nr:hypothetical protein C8R47DRAFT_1286276 [Mycena vitilis]